MSHAVTRTTLIALQAFVVITAIVGAIFVVPTLPSDWIRTGPMDDFTVPAVALGVFVGGSALVAYVLLVFDHAWSGVAAMLAGATIVAFEFVEIAVVGFAPIVRGLDQFPSWLQVVYIAMGVAGMTLGYHLWHVPPVPRAYARHGR